MPFPNTSYWHLSRSLRYSLTFALPLLLLYETLALALSHDAMAGVRNGADVLLKSLFVLLGGQRGLIVFGVLLIGTGMVLVFRDLRANRGAMRGRVFAGMAGEAVVYALAFGLVAGTLTNVLLAAARTLAQAQMGERSWPTQFMVSLGAGIYEELLFRVILVSLLAKLASLVFGWKPVAAGVFATLLGAFVFSAFHYIGPYGDPLELRSFTFRAVAGVLFSGLYLTRGLGITAWTHALYDVFLTLA